MSEMLEAPEAAQEEESHTLSHARRLDLNLQGVRRLKLLTSQPTNLSLTFPLLPAETIRTWQQFFAARRDRPSFLLVRSNRSIVEVSLEKSVASASLRLDLIAADVASFSPFEEVDP
jgi:hypothetical protein